MRLLLLSNSTNFGAPYLQHGAPVIGDFLAPEKEVLFIPYAGITIAYDEYEQKVSEALMPFGIEVKSIHRFDNPIKAVQEAKGIVIGGGNTFRLLKLLQVQQLIEPIQKAIKDGIPYIGWSAGSNVAGISIKTTNDMPVEQPLTFTALQFAPFQLNPHFTNDILPNHNGETRIQRLTEFAVLNPEVPVIGLREGTWITLDNEQWNYFGESDYLFMKGNRQEFRKDQIISLQ